jgi:hypothetical protein
VSTGVIDPSTRQCAGSPFAASTHVGGDNVTLLTGCPIADVAIDVPTFEPVQSDAVITTSGADRRTVPSDEAGA